MSETGQFDAEDTFRALTWGADSGSALSGGAGGPPAKPEILAAGEPPAPRQPAEPTAPATVAASGGAGGSPAKPETLAAGEPFWHSRHYLPHLENKHLQFITYRLFDSVPKTVLDVWRRELAISEDIDANAPECQELRRRVEQYADAGYGSCLLSDPRIAEMVQDNLLHFDGERYRLVAWCIMPNHVHVLVEVADGFTLSTILHSWRSYTAHEANKILCRTGEFWQSEYFDRFIRNTEHLCKTIEYIFGNPDKAGLVEWKWRGVLWDALSGEALSGGAGGPPAKPETLAAGEPPAPRQPAEPTAPATVATSGGAGGPPAKPVALAAGESPAPRQPAEPTAPATVAASGGAGGPPAKPVALAAGESPAPRQPALRHGGHE